MMETIRVLFILPSLKRAGAEIQTVNLVNILDDKFQKYLFTFESNLDQLGKIDNEKVCFENTPRRYKYDITPVRSIARIIDREKIDVIFCTLQFSLLLGWLARKIAKRKPPLVTALHTTVNRSYKEEIQDRFLYQFLLRQCLRIVFVCKAQRNYWEKKYPCLKGIAQVVYNGVDVKHFDPMKWHSSGLAMRHAMKIPDDTPVIACVARFSPEKGHHLLIEALSRISYRPFLLLAGDGKTRLAIETLVREKGLSDRVKFLGNLEDIRALLAMVDLTVIASTAVETFSIAMLESMSMATPLVASNIGGMSEAIISGETGFLVPPGDVAQLANVLELALEDRDVLKDMGRKARAFVEKQFTVAKMVAQTGEVLRSAVVEKT